MPLSLDRHRGCLLGLAAGDAVGTTLEFHSPGSFTPIADMVGGGPFRLAPGQWTDDTSMALCLAESLVEHPEFDPVDQLRRYVRWYREGYLSSTGRCFDIGNTCRQALARFEREPRAFCGSTEAHTAGNGSLMRLAPVAMRYAGSRAAAMELAAASSRTTHAAPEAVDSCRYFAALLVDALNGASKEELLAPWNGSPLAPAVAAVAAGSFLHREPPDIRGAGYVVRSLEAALWAFHRSASFAEAVLLAANLGDDADTTAAICGQIAGAHYGEQCIPAQWRERLALRSTIEHLAGRLFALAAN